MKNGAIDFVIVVNRGGARARRWSGPKRVGDGGHVDELKGRRRVGWEIGVEALGPAVAAAAAKPEG